MAAAVGSMVQPLKATVPATVVSATSPLARRRARAEGTAVVIRRIGLTFPRPLRVKMTNR